MTTRTHQTHDNFLAPDLPTCFKCRSPVVHIRRVSDLETGQLYDVFQCSECKHESLMPVSEQ